MNQIIYKINLSFGRDDLEYIYNIKYDEYINQIKITYLINYYEK